MKQNVIPYLIGTVYVIVGALIGEVLGNFLERLYSNKSDLLTVGVILCFGILFSGIIISLGEAIRKRL